jgi:drug/metabolite transporter superfamily protein YnfA
MADMASASTGDGVAFLVAAGITYEIIASKRAATLMKWVHVGILQAAIFVAVAAAVEPKHRGPIIAGGVTGGVFLYVSYAHAKRAGLKGGGAATESW